MVEAATPESTSRRRGMGLPSGHELLVFVAVALLVLVAVSLGSVIASERLARANALAEAERTTVRLADLLIGPFMDDYLADAPGQRRALDRLVTLRLTDEDLHAVLVWNADGRVIYSSDEELIGEVSEPSEELHAALSGNVRAEVDESPDVQYGDAQPGPVLEVYAPIRDVEIPLVLEAYFDYSVIEEQTDLLRSQILPIAIGGLVVLQLVQIPIAASLAGRVRRHQDERARLVERNLAESERERRIIAADLHDGPVQDLAGVGYALSALRSSVAPDRQPTVDRLLGTVRHAVASLRQVMIDVYPPDLSGEGLPQAVHMLAERLRDQGIEVHVDTGALPPVGSDQAAALYRTVKESLANVVHHAQASQVWVRLVSLDGAGPHRVCLEVADDGVGFLPDTIGRSPEGHLGLQLMCERLAHLGGRVEFSARPGGGAMVTVELPVKRAQ